MSTSKQKPTAAKSSPSVEGAPDTEGTLTGPVPLAIPPNPLCHPNAPLDTAAALQSALHLLDSLTDDLDSLSKGSREGFSWLVWGAKSASDYLVAQLDAEFGG